ncbi:MAG: hypothetical protein IKP86_02855 [Anaerolineaceae bacterium]|nr:hypothetical protein [Anaerolineaceae bacterium]
METLTALYPEYQQAEGERDKDNFGVLRRAGNLRKDIIHLQTLKGIRPSIFGIPAGSDYKELIRKDP